jgi:hypothetical protein
LILLYQLLALGFDRLPEGSRFHRRHERCGLLNSLVKPLTGPKRRFGTEGAAKPAAPSDNAYVVDQPQNIRRQRPIICVCLS